MNQPAPDALLRAYATLEALGANAPRERTMILGSTVRRYNDALDRLGESLGKDFSEFRVPPQDMHASLSGDETETLSDHYRERVDAALNYIRLLMPGDAPRKLGFVT